MRGKGGRGGCWRGGLGGGEDSTAFASGVRVLVQADTLVGPRRFNSGNRGLEWIDCHGWRLGIPYSKEWTKSMQEAAVVVPS